MKLNKANLAGLTSPGQQSEMKSILAGTWPPLKPLPVFKYETEGYRASIAFDKKRGEWVCRNTSLPSNEVQELRGGLREITLALPHGEGEIFTEVVEPQEPELERESNRRLQAIREWREKYGNGARYSELRENLTESQRTELDDSLRLSLTARQLQFNAKNAADVFDDLSVAGGRFAALIEFAKRNKAEQGTHASAHEEGTLLEAEPTIAPDTIDHGDDSLEISSHEFGDALHNNDPVVPPQEAAEVCDGAEEFPALSIKNVFPEQELTPLAERTAHAASQQFGIEDFDIEASEISGENSPLLVEDSHAEHSHSEQSCAEPFHRKQRPSPVFTDFAAQVPADQPFADRIAGSSSRFPFRISAFQANAFALLFLFAATSFTVGLTVGRGPLGRRLREAPKSLLASDAKPPTPTLPDAAPSDGADESSSPISTLPAASSDDSAGVKRFEDAPPPKDSEAESKESHRDSEDSAEVTSTDADSSLAAESKPTVQPEVAISDLRAERSGAIEPVPRKVLPPTVSRPAFPSTKLARRPRVVSRAVRSLRSAPKSPAPYRLTSAINAAPHVPRSSTILVTVPNSGSQPFRVSFPNKTIAATSSLAMTAQLSVLVLPEPGPAAGNKSARLEAGELVSFGWPRYSESKGRYGWAETIRVRAAIGQFGDVQEVKFLGGSASLLPATMEAIRQWRYRPTLLNNRPVQAQQDITIEFRPPQYSARLSNQHPPHN